MVGRTTAKYIQLGVAAMHLEDQVVTKRCGHLKNKELVDEATFVNRITAAVNMRAQMEGDIVIIARTDALQGLGYEAAMKRLEACLAAGADVAFLEGVTSKEEARNACERLKPHPVLLNMVSGGVTPEITVEEARQIGFKIIIYPGFALGPVYEAVKAAAKELALTGTMKPSSEISPKELFTVCGLNEAMAFDMAAGGKSYQNGV